MSEELLKNQTPFSDRFTNLVKQYMVTEDDTTQDASVEIDFRQFIRRTLIESQNEFFIECAILLTEIELANNKRLAKDTNDTNPPPTNTGVLVGDDDTKIFVRVIRFKNDIIHSIEIITNNFQQTEGGLFTDRISTNSYTVTVDNSKGIEVRHFWGVNSRKGRQDNSEQLTSTSDLTYNKDKIKPIPDALSAIREFISKYDQGLLLGSYHRDLYL